MKHGLTDTTSNTGFRILLLLLGILGVLLVVTTIHGAFIVDEINYMVNVIGLREGRLTVPGTEGFTPSRELLYFDPEPYVRTVTSTPVFSIAPPLYAPLAFPFVYFGWNGLTFVNILSFLLSALLIFQIVRRKSVDPSSPWLATVLFVAAGYSLEYAQGVWPHMLSVLLVVTAVYCIVLTWQGKNAIFSFIGGIFMGLACGVRDQNIFLAGCIGLVVLIWSERRMSTTGLYAAGAAIPLLTSATINFYRFGVFYPTPKAYAYVQFVSKPVESGAWLKPLEVFLVKIVDFSTFVWFQDPSQFVDYARESSTGAYLVGGVVKQAFLQSSPWIALALVLSVAIWLKSSVIAQDLKRNVRALSVLILLPLLMFSMAGFRTDGLCFNQRYLLEIVPLAAVIVALGLDRIHIPSIHVIVGSLLSALSFALLLMVSSRDVQHLAILRVPLVLGIILALAWFLRNRTPGKQVLALSLGLCIGWSFMVQTLDFTASRRIRETNAVGLDSLEAKIPNHAALFTFWGAQKSTAGPMQLNKDVVILDAWADMGKDAPLLARQLLQQKRRVFLYGTGMPSDIVHSIRGKDSLAVALTNPFLLYELVEPGQAPTSVSQNLLPH